MDKQQTTQRDKARPRVELNRAYDDFVLSRRAKNVSPRTLDFYDDKLLPFVTWAQENGAATADAVTTAKVRAYVVSLQARNLSPWTVHGAARAIRAFLRFCAEEDYRDTAPRFAMPKLPKTILPALEPGDVQRLLAACESDRDKALMLFLCSIQG